MQNIDFYERKNARSIPPQMDDFDPEFFQRMAPNVPREADRVRKKASRTFFLILSLCIVTFTIGIVIGLKFAGGRERQIVDKSTFNAMTDMGKNITNLISDKTPDSAPRNNPFPKKSYPYVVKLQKEYTYSSSQKIAGLLSRKGHTVILAKNNNKYRIFVGPYKNLNDAETALQKISGYQKYSLAENIRIIKR